MHIKSKNLQNYIHIPTCTIYEYLLMRIMEACRHVRDMALKNLISFRSKFALYVFNSCKIPYTYSRILKAIGYLPYNTYF